MLLLIDNYDSFAWNLVHYLGELGAETHVMRNDALTPDSIPATLSAYEAVVISPGPCDPDKAGISMEIVRQAAGHIPVLGVCLGHQAVAQAFGATIVRADAPVHGKLSRINHDGGGLFDGLPESFMATRYHSLVVSPSSLPESLLLTASTDDGAVVMGVAHRELPIYGVQFHPESIACEHGHQILKNFLTEISS